MNIIDYSPFLMFNSFYGANGSNKYLNMFDAIEKLSSTALESNTVKFLNASEYISPTLRSISMYLVMRQPRYHDDEMMMSANIISANITHMFDLVCALTDKDMYEKYRNHKLTDTLNKKLFRGGLPFLKPIILRGPQIIFNEKSVQMRLWANTNSVTCIENEIGGYQQAIAQYRKANE